MKTKDLNLMSMEELNRIARNEGEDILIRRSALAKLDAREKEYFGRHYPTGGNGRTRNYVPGL